MKTNLDRRRALLTLLAATPVLAFQTPGETFKPLGFRVDATAYDSTTSLLDLRLNFPEAGDREFLFLRITINGKEEVRLSIKEALGILRGPGGPA
jgi:hypothetical protein